MKIALYTMICSTIEATSRARILFRIGMHHNGFVSSCMSTYSNCLSSNARSRSSGSKSTRPLETETLCKQFPTIAKLFKGVSNKTHGSNNKISVIGLDELGIATVYTLIAQKITDHICMVDLDEDVLKGELMDLELGSLFHNNAKILTSRDPADTANSKICVLITGTCQGRYEEPSAFVDRSIGIIKALVPPIVKCNPNAIIIIASDPVDILSYVAWKLSGYPQNRIIGTGTLLDTARFRCLLAKKMGISPHYCHGYIIGEHGENSVPVWSGVNIGGVRLKDINPKVGDENDTEQWHMIHKEALACKHLVRKLKGYSAWSEALAISHLCQSIINNSNAVMPLSTCAKGEHLILEDVFLSLPCVVGSMGITDVIRQTLSENESGLLRKCVVNMRDMQRPADKLLLS